MRSFAFTASAVCRDVSTFASIRTAKNSCSEKVGDWATLSIRSRNRPPSQASSKESPRVMKSSSSIEETPASFFSAPSMIRRSCFGSLAKRVAKGASFSVSNLTFASALLSFQTFNNSWMRSVPRPKVCPTADAPS